MWDIAYTLQDMGQSSQFWDTTDHFVNQAQLNAELIFFFLNLKEHWNTKNKKASFSLTLEIQRITINTSKNGHLIIHTLVFAHADHKKCFAGHMSSNPTVHILYLWRSVNPITD